MTLTPSPPSQHEPGNITVPTGELILPGAQPWAEAVAGRKATVPAKAIRSTASKVTNIRPGALMFPINTYFCPRVDDPGLHNAYGNLTHLTRLTSRFR